jgi:hypothetical protein
MEKARVTLDDSSFASQSAHGNGSPVPVCVDLDGTLVRSDLLIESFLGLLKKRPWLTFVAPFWLLGGKAALKQRIASRSDLDVESLPYDRDLLAWHGRAPTGGRANRIVHGIR